MRVILCVLVFYCCTLEGQRVNYEGYKVYKVFTIRPGQMRLLKKFETDYGVDIWNEVRRTWDIIQVMVPPKVQHLFTSKLRKEEIPFQVMIKNMEEILMGDEIQERMLPLEISEGMYEFDKYLTVDEIYSYIDNLASNRSNVNVRTFGRSSEGRDLRVVSVCSNTCGSKPAIVVDGGIHAREWIAPATVLYILTQLVLHADKNKEFVDNLDWYIAPVLNPDGYEYSHTTDRFWRKTRSSSPFTNCYGADPNRNFGFFWGGPGTSSDPCSEIYKGKYPFSEPESLAWAQFGMTVKNHTKLYLTFHSHGRYILYPWGYTWQLPSDWRELHKLGDMVNEALNNTYKIGSSANVLYIAAGGSDDWFKGMAGVQLSYTIELPGGGSKGFDPPPDSIAKMVTETYEGVKVFADYIIKKFGKKNCGGN